MKDYVNQTILYINLSESWGMNEKFLIRDVEIVDNLGYQVLVLCVRDSYLDLKLRALNVPTVYDRTKNHSWIWRPFSFFLELRSIISKNSISLVHTYDFFSLWPLGSLLKRYPYIPLVYTRSQEVKKRMKSFLHRLFLSRLDLLIAPAKGLRENFISCLPIRPKRIHVSGLGIKFHQESSKEIKSLKKSLLARFGKSLDLFCIGTYVAVDMKDAQPLFPVFVALQFIIQNRPDLNEEVKIQLFVFCERNWKAHSIYEELKKKVEEFGLQDQVVFYTTDELEQNVGIMDSWISYYDQEYIGEQEIYALYYGVHLVLPRVAGHYEVLLDHSWGHTYKANDSRDLRYHLEFIITSPKAYSLEDTKIGREFLKIHSWNEHRVFLEQSYLKLMSRRYRLFSARKRLKRILKNVRR